MTTLENRETVEAHPVEIVNKIVEIPVVKKPSGLGKKRPPADELEEEKEELEATAFVLPDHAANEGSDADGSGAESGAADLEMMFDTLEVAVAEGAREERPSPQTVLLMRAVVHEADRLLKEKSESQQGCDERVEFILATGLYYLALYEKEEGVQVDFLRAALERVSHTSPLYRQAGLLLSIYDRSFDFDVESVEDLPGAIVEYPPSAELCAFLTRRHERTKSHDLLLLLANAAGLLESSPKVQEMTAAYLRDCLPRIPASEPMQRAEVLIVLGGLMEALDEEGWRECYAEATDLLQGKSALPSWVQDFLTYESENEESENANDDVDSDSITSDLGEEEIDVGEDN